jgi:hypothetical protein
VSFFYATGKLPAGVVAAQKIVVTIEKMMVIYYRSWFNSRTVATAAVCATTLQ